MGPMQYYNNVFRDYDAREFKAPNPPGVGGCEAN
jgi:hypothetical protein